MIKLSGDKPNVGIYTGLGPRENLYEDKEEEAPDTPNKLIHIGKPIEFDEESFFEDLKEGVSQEKTVLAS